MCTCAASIKDDAEYLRTHSSRDGVHLHSGLTEGVRFEGAREAGHLALRHHKQQQRPQQKLHRMGTCVSESPGQHPLGKCQNFSWSIMYHDASNRPSWWQGAHQHTHSSGNAPVPAAS